MSRSVTSILLDFIAAATTGHHISVV